MVTDFIKRTIQRNGLLSFTITPVYWYFSRIKHKVLLGGKNPSMLAGELNLFTKIFQQCKVIVDVGARYDVDYLSISQGHRIKYYLFEANPKFYKKLITNLSVFSEDITVENLAVSDKPGLSDYFEETQSIVKNTLNTKSTKNPSAIIEMVRLDDYFAKKRIYQIDFLKTDIEMNDYFALLGLGKLLHNTLYLQFELGIDAEFEDRFVTNSDYYELLEPIFDLYICKDENLSLWSHFGITLDLIKLDYRAKDFIIYAQKNGEGFNIFGVNKTIKSNLSDLQIDIL
jgi:FkbM family methyltransferase